MKTKEILETLKSLSDEEALIFLSAFSDENGKQVTKLADTYRKRLAAKARELERLFDMTVMERTLVESGYRLVGGVDEAGRGPLAGPVVAACVILPEGCFLEKLNDSKKLSAAVRDRLFDEIREKAIAWGIGIVDEAIIDDINILNATKKAMKIAIGALKQQPDALIIDAVKLDLPIHQVSIPKADEKSLAVAAASVLAKVSRDRMMDKMDAIYPIYGFAKNKGYGTAEHIDAIRSFGPCPIHRNSFIGNFL